MATIVKSTEIPAPPEEVWAVISDPSRSEEWQTIHAGYPDGAPGTLGADSEFRQKVKIMGMPGEVKWKVTEADEPNRLALEGEGPMGTTLSTRLHHRRPERLDQLHLRDRVRRRGAGADGQRAGEGVREGRSGVDGEAQGAVRVGPAIAVTLRSRSNR